MPRKGDSHGRQPPWRHGAHPHLLLLLRHRHFPLRRPSPWTRCPHGGHEAQPPPHALTNGRLPTAPGRERGRGRGGERGGSGPSLCPSACPPRGSAHLKAVPAHCERGRREWGMAGLKRFQPGNHLGNNGRNDGRPGLAGG